MTSGEYVGSSDKELLETIRDVWKMVDKYELLPTKTNKAGKEMALGRTRRPAMVAIGIRELPELPGTLAQRQQEQNRRQRADLKIHI